MVRWSVEWIGADGLVKVGHCFIVHPRRLLESKGRQRINSRDSRVFGEVERERVGEKKRKNGRKMEERSEGGRKWEKERERERRRRRRKRGKGSKGEMGREGKGEAV
jgi:hypothetical protein